MADTGVGIASDMLGRVFEVFAQAERTLGRGEGGMGLGLAIVRSIVHLHGGRVEAASPGIGKGSTFVVRLPTASVSPSQAPKPDAEAIAVRPLRVVIVEDNEDNREMMTALLELGGHEIASAHDGPSGLAKILAAAPAIAFVDLGLPGFDGLELARRLRAAGSASRLVAITGYGQPEDRQRALAAGFDDHLTKAVGEREISRALRAMTPPNS